MTDTIYVARDERAPNGGRPLRVLLRRPLLVGMAALATVAVVTLGLALVVVTVLGPRVDRANDMLSALQDGHIAMINQETGLRGFLVTREARFLEPYWKGVADLERADAALEALTRTEPELAEYVAALQAAEQDYIRQWAEPTLAEQPAIGDTVALSTLLRQDKRLFDRYRTVEADVRVAVENQRARAGAQRTVVVLAGAILALSVAVGVAVAVRRANRRLAWQLLPPTQRVRDALAALAAGDLDSRATESGPAELRDIAGDVNTLGEALRERGELVAARERELMGARDVAERAGQAKTAFLATMSHEIRTPLNAVLGLTDVLLTTDLTEEQRGHLETISGSGDSLLTLINDILDFSKIEAGELDLEQAPFDVRGTVYDVAQLLAPLAAAKGLDLLVDIAPECPVQAVGDGARLRQVMTNLIANAVKFTATGQVLVDVTSTVTGDRLRCRLAVSDTGIGIPEEQRDRLFRSFSQGDASITRSYGGTGLGLAISQRIAQAMGGEITVDSSVGNGSTFTVILDLGVAPTVPERRSPEGLSGRRLLVVDDNSTNLRILQHQLGQFGAVCVLAADGPAALRLLEDEPAFDAGVLDLHMPGMGGDELAARLRAHPAAAALPLVLLSSSTRLQPGGEELFAARLHKPVRPERLLQTLRSVLQPEVAGPLRRASDRPVAQPGRGRRLRVLVAEDHAVNAHLMGLYLGQLGHDSDHVTNGREAVEAVRRGHYDVVLMDAQMPVMGGVDATTAIRALPGHQPRILAVTASVLASDRTAFLAAGADDFLTKPVRMATLDDALTSWGQAPGGVLPDDAAPVPVADETDDTPDDGRPDDGTPDDGTLDAETVEELRDLGEAAFQHLYEQYVDSLAATVAAIFTAADGASWSSDDDGSVPRLAHRLKGSSAALGAHRMADLCRRLEEGGSTETTVADPAAVDAALAELESESRRVQAAVATLLDGTP